MNTTTKNLQKRGRGLAISLLSFGYFWLALAPAYASDTEVYSQTANPNAGTTPTVMLSLDGTTPMNNCIYNYSSCATTDPNNTRLKALQRAIRKVLLGDNTVTPAILPAPGHVRVGLSFIGAFADAGTNAATAVRVRYPVRRLDDPATSNTNFIFGSGQVVTVPLTNGNQDAEQAIGGGSVLQSNSTLSLAVRGNTDINQHVGLQFPKVEVPKGAVITAAYLAFTAAESRTGSVSWDIAIEDSDNASANFGTTGLDTGRTYTTAVEFVASDWTAESTYGIPVTNLVQHVVNRAGWCGGKGMSFRITDRPSEGPIRRLAYSYEGAPTPAKRPYLILAYTLSAAAAANSCMWQDINTSIKVTNALDDVEVKNTAVAPSRSGGLHVVEVTTSGGSTVKTQSVLRFNNLPIENNSVAGNGNVILTEATLNMVGLTAQNNQMQDISVAAFQTDNMAAVCSNSTTCTAPAAGVSATPVTWSFSPAKVDAEVTYPLNVLSIVGPIFQRAGWARNNSLGLRLQNNGTTTKPATFYDYDSTASKAPTLTLKGAQKLTQLTPVIATTTSTPSPRTVRDELVEAVDAMEISANGSPPNGLIESARYYLGKAPFSNKSDSTALNAAGTLYNSPITSSTQCSGYYLLQVSGGDPASASNVNVNAQGVKSTACAADSAFPIVGQSNNASTWECMVGVAKHMADPNNEKFTTVKTNTLLIGVMDPADDNKKIEDNFETLASAGQGTGYTAASEADLVKSLQDTIAGALDDGATISAPGVAVNQLSRLTHLDQLYYSVFDPAGVAYWRGNVKRYRLGFQGTAPTVFDSTGVPAIDSTTSFFKETSKSWWGENSRTADGRIARNGGAAKVMPPPDVSTDARTFVLNSQTLPKRKMFTYLGTYPTTPATTATTLETVGVADATFNTNAKTIMGVSDDNSYQRLIYWLLGYDIDVYSGGLLSTDPITVTEDTSLRREMGGALHSRPIVVNYGYSGSDIAAALADASLQDNTAYFSTMEGVLHAIDTNNGVEEFSFISKEKLPKLATLARNTPTAEPEYGMDLTWTVLREDNNSDFKISVTEGGSPTGDKVWLFGGMRMGGSNYYALDVTDRAAPKLKWVLQGGTGVFANMGQTWSQPEIGYVKINGVKKTVLFIGGGYDPDHESKTYLPTSDDQGNQVYIVDAHTGQVYWWTSSTDAGTTAPSLRSTDMKFSIPSGIKPFDYNGDGLDDALYFGDLGGQVFRIDLNNANTSAGDLGVRVRLLAKLGQTSVASPTVTNQRRFFEIPTVARFSDPSIGRFVQIGIGSGYRSHPLVGANGLADNPTEDFIYVLRDNDVVRADISSGNATSTASGALQATITPAELATVADPETVTATGVSIAGYMGWKADLPDIGEKVLAAPLFFNGKIFFTTYVPTVENANPCLPIYGRTKLYEVSAINAALPDTNNDGVVNSNDRSVTDNVVLGLGGEVQAIKLPGDNPSGCDSILLVGTSSSCGDNDRAGALQRLRWYNKVKN